MNWAGVKFAHDYAKTNGIPFKEHTLLWYQDAWNLGWLMNLDNANRKIQI
jgi:GH35 family endo-1,4-beta-xylanase